MTAPPPSGCRGMGETEAGPGSRGRTGPYFIVLAWARQLACVLDLSGRFYSERWPDFEIDAVRGTARAVSDLTTR